MSLRSAEVDGGSSSLALLRRTLLENQVLRCPRRFGWFLIGGETGQVIPARCKASFCGWCGPIRAREVAGAIGLANPERLVRLSLLRGSWRETQWRVWKVVYELRAAGYVFEYCLHVEPNPKETGYHGHLYQVGAFVPQAFLQSCCLRHGLGFPDIRKFERRGGPEVTYGLKLAGLNYGLKLAQRQDSLDRYLEVNGGRLSHQSRAFFRNAAGDPCGLTEARAAWRSLAVAGVGQESWSIGFHPEWEGVSNE
jgi:hypothetical protein